MRLVPLPQAAEYGNAVQHGQHQLEDEHIGMQLADSGQCLFAVLGYADQFHVISLLHRRRQSRAKFGVVICN